MNRREQCASKQNDDDKGKEQSDGDNNDGDEMAFKNNSGISVTVKDNDNGAD